MVSNTWQVGPIYPNSKLDKNLKKKLCVRPWRAPQSDTPRRLAGATNWYTGRARHAAAPTLTVLCWRENGFPLDVSRDLSRSHVELSISDDMCRSVRPRLAFVFSSSFFFRAWLVAIAQIDFYVNNFRHHFKFQLSNLFPWLWLFSNVSNYYYIVWGRKGKPKIEIIQAW